MVDTPGTRSVDSPDGTYVEVDEGQIVCNAKSFWVSKPDPDPAIGSRVVIEGQPDMKTSRVVGLYKEDGQLWQTNQDGGWWRYDATAGWPWIEGENPMTGGGGQPEPPGGGTPPHLPGPPYNGSVDFSRTTGKKLPATLFGMGTGALQDDNYGRLGDDLVISQLGKIRPHCFRLHAQHEMAQRVANGDRSTFDRWVKGFPKFLAEGAMQIIGVGPPFDRDAPGPQARANHAAALARAFKDAGHEQFYWEVGNECENLGIDRYCQHFVACADALHGVNSRYQVGGAVGMWWGSINIGEFVHRVGAQRLGFFVFHSYPCGGAGSDAECYRRAADFGDVVAARGALRSAGVPDSVPIRLLEWNQDGANHGGIWGSPAQTDHRGAVFFALLLQRAFQSDPNFDAAACWDAIADSYFGQIGPAPAYNNNVITPSGHYLRLAGEHLAGSEITTSADMGNFRVLGTVNGKNFTLQCVNYDQGKSQTYNPDWKGATVATFQNRYDVGKGAASGSVVEVALPIVVPSETISIITGTLQ